MYSSPTQPSEACLRSSSPESTSPFLTNFPIGRSSSLHGPKNLSAESRIRNLAHKLNMDVKTGSSLPIPLNYASGYVDANKISPDITNGSPRLQKRIIVCCDGTWNDGIKSAPNKVTNVLKLSRCIFPEDRRTFPPTPQVVFYQAGLGTTDDLLLNFAQGATGVGILAKIREAYAFIAQNYIPGDEIFLFGFSRGAFTARTIASLILDIGILSTAGMEDFYQVLAAYQVRSEGTENADIAEKFLDKYRQDGSRKHVSRMAEGALKCVGVWDTVGALGMPGFFARNFNLLGFRDTKLGRNIKYAFHAIALHETRQDFTATKWVRTASKALRPYQILKQVWFSGSHSDVGGGYENHDLSDISLIWMVANLIKYNLLSINEEYLETLPFPQAGWGEQAPHDPRKGVMSKTIKTVRKFPTEWDPTSMETIHPSVAFQKQLEPELASIFKADGCKLVEKLLPFEVKMRDKWDSFRKPKLDFQEKDPLPEVDGESKRSILSTYFLKNLSSLGSIGRLKKTIFRDQFTDEEFAKKVLESPVNSLSSQSNEDESTGLDSNPDPKGRALLADFSSALHGLIDIGLLSLEIARGGSSSEELSKQILESPVQEL